MADEIKPRRRRRPQQVVPPPEEETPLRIIVGGEADEPDWMVSAGELSGAASRRGKRPEPKAKTREAQPHTAVRGVQESQAILTLRRKAAGKTEPNAAQSKAPSARKADAPQAAAKPTARKVSTAKPTAKASATNAAEPKAAKPRKASAPKAAKPAVRKPAKKPAKKKLSKKARERRAQRIRRTVITVLAGAVCCMLVAVAAIGGGRLVNIKKTLDRGSGVFYPNIFVNDIPLEGRTLDEAAAVVTQQVNALLASFRITLRTQDGRSWDITGDDLQMKVDVADQLDQLWAIGHTGSSSVRYEQVKALEAEPAMRYTTLTYDMSRVNQILTQIKNEVDQPAVSAKRVPDDTKWPPFSYTDDVPGQTLDISGLSERIAGMVDRLETGVVDLTPTPVQAALTRAQLEEQIVKLSSFETTLGKTGDYVAQREENIRIGTEKFNHLTIKPGESVSFNKVTGKRTEANGYQKSLEIAYGEYREGVGGGICQVSSTLYNAVVNAGLRVNKRTPHAIPSSYVDMGLDATVSDDRYDFVFTNTTNADIYIESEFYKAKNYWHTRFTIYGRPDPNGYTYKLESNVTQKLALPEPEYRQDKEGRYVIYNDETYQSSKGREGYVVDTYLVTYDRNGLEVDRKLQYTDTYKPSAPVIYTGVTPRETPMPEGYMPLD